jgi:hypothetical protein
MPLTIRSPRIISSRLQRQKTKLASTIWLISLLHSTLRTEAKKAFVLPLIFVGIAKILRDPNSEEELFVFRAAFRRAD